MDSYNLDVNIFELPLVLLKNCSKLPKCSAVYFVFLSDGEVLYIGQTENLWRRWTTHHQKKTIFSIGEAFISWIEVEDKDSRLFLEFHYSTLLKPRLWLGSDELSAWLQEHETDGMILNKAGHLVPVIKCNSVEFSGCVSENDLSKALLYSAPWGFKKAGIGVHGIMSLVRQYPISEMLDISNLKTYQEDAPNTQLFRCRIPEGTMQILQKFCAGHKLNRSQVATLVLKSFVNDPAVFNVYKEWEADWGLPPEKVRQAVLSWFQLDKATKQYSLAKRGNPEAGKEKMT